MGIFKDIKAALFSEQGKHERLEYSIEKNGEKLTVSRSRAVVASKGDWFYLKSKHGCHKIAAAGYAPELNIDSDHNDIAIASNSAEVFIGGQFNKVAVTGSGARVTSVGFANVIAVLGAEGAASAKVGSWITLAERKYSAAENAAIPVYMKTEYVDGERIKADVMYTLIDGEFVALDALDFDFNFA